MGIPGTTTTYVYRTWLPPAARRKQREIERLQREVQAAEILIDLRTGHTFQFRDGQKVAVPQSMVPKKVRDDIRNQSSGVVTG